MRLEDLASVFVGEIALFDTNKQIVIRLDCDTLKVKCWVGVVPAPSVLMAFCDTSGEFSVVLDCDMDALCSFYVNTVDRYRDFTDNRWTGADKVTDLVMQEVI